MKLFHLSPSLLEELFAAALYVARAVLSSVVQVHYLYLWFFCPRLLYCSIQNVKGFWIGKVIYFSAWGGFDIMPFGWEDVWGIYMEAKDEVYDISNIEYKGFMRRDDDEAWLQRPRSRRAKPGDIDGEGLVGKIENLKLGGSCLVNREGRSIGQGAISAMVSSEIDMQVVPKLDVNEFMFMEDLE
ncbi:uncharacterized protein DS421_18g627130 [Arachis hypogaea]|nr:uncharacterized protein DS421_18g627130 [Arachis hypogaea]